MNASHKIVVVGASAGGLSALERFFGEVPTDCGMAFLVVQHLSSDHESLLKDLLAKKTQLPVCEIEDGQKLEPNRIYVSPPRKLPVAEGSTVRLKEWPEGKKLVLPINTCMRSLAETVGDSAVAVVLSGTGSDGTEGAGMINSRGGQVFVQSPSDCEFSGMPQSVLAAGILCKESNAPELWGLIEKGASLVKGGQLDSGNVPDFETYRKLFEHLHQEFDLDFSTYQWNSISRRVERRMYLMSISGTSEYLEYIRENPEESKALFKDLLIGVTEFFRNKSSFDTLSAQALEPALKKCRNKEFRIWAAGCASGEEAYSLCILATEAAEKVGYSGRVSVFATDVFQPSIDIASAGVYDAKKLESLSDVLLDRYFSRTSPSLYQVKTELRARVVFANHNFLVDPPFANIDLVSCRNVLIYLTPETQELALKSFSYALGGDGILFLGNSESVGKYKSTYTAISQREKIFKKEDAALDKERWVKPYQYSWAVKRNAEEQEKPSASTAIKKDLLNAYDSLLARFAPDGFLVNKDCEILHYLGNASDFCVNVRGRVNSDVSSQVGDDLRLALTSLFHQVVHHNKRCAVKHVRCLKREGESLVDVTIEPISAGKGNDRIFLIELHEAKSAPKHAQPEASGNDEPEVLDCSLREQLRMLEDELRDTKENFNAVNEALQAANEELNSYNEEMNVSNEELQSSNEELNSMNEELITVNAEFERSNQQLNELNVSHENLLRSSEDGILFVDKEMSICRYNSSIARAFNLQPADIGRSLLDISYNLGNREQLLRDVRDILDGKNRVERETSFVDGQRYLIRVTPFHNDRKVVEGALLIFTDVTKMRELERRFEYAVQAARMSWWDWDLESGRLEVYSAGDCLLGADCLNAQRDRAGWMEAVHPDDREMVAEGLEAHLRGETDEWVCQHRFQTSAEEWLWVSNRGVVTRRNPEGKPLEMIGTTQDIDAYQKALIAVTGQRNILEAAGQIASLGAWEYEVETKRLVLSAEVYRILDLEIGSEISAEDSFQYFSPASREIFEKAFVKALNEGIEYDLELECINASGTHLITRTLGQPQVDSAGKVVRLVGVFQDITEVAKTEQGMRSFFALSPDFQATVDFDGIFQSFSQTWSNEFEIDPGSMKVTSVVSLICPQDRPEFKEILASVIQGAQAKSYEARMLACREAGSGSEDEDVWLSWSLSSDARLGLVFISARNITEQKYATQRLNDARLKAEGANLAKSEFLSVMSHELRTPLNPILGYAEILADEVEDPEHREVLKTIIKSGEHMISLIDEILDYSKVEAGRVEVVPVEFSLIDLMVDKVNLMAGSLKRDEVKLSYELHRGPFEENGLPMFRGDAEMLRHIVHNLLGNAMKFTKAGHIILRVVILSADNSDAKVAFEVEDTGIGIAQADQEQIFEAFTQADSTLTRAYGGTGLGLAICKRLTGLLGGTIAVESEKGKGSLFRVTIPLRVLAEGDESDSLKGGSESPASKPIAPKPKYSGTRVLVVEDDEANATYITSLLKRYDLNPMWVPSGEEALEALDQHAESFAVVYLDLHMPGIGGLATLGEIRRRGSKVSGKRLPVIILSASVEPDTRQECFRLGADAFLSKPLSIDRMEGTLSDWILEDANVKD